MSDAFIWGTGRRKTAVARVRLSPGSGEFKVNGKALGEYFPTVSMRNIATGPLAKMERTGKYDILANVTGGGPLGQAGALSLGIARALKQVEGELDASLRDHGLLTRDARMKERKKYGQRGARRRFQFSKR